MKWSVPCTSMGLQAVALPYGNSSSAIKSALKKSLRAAEQDRPDVAQARRSWKRRQGMLAPKGQGNDAFFRFALKLRKAGLSPPEINAILTEEASYAHSPKDRRAQIPYIMDTLFKKRRRAERSECGAPHAQHQHDYLNLFR